MTLEQEKEAITRQAILLLSRLIEDYNRVVHSEAYQGIFVLAHVHGVSYHGPFHDDDLYREAADFVTTHANFIEGERTEETAPPVPPPEPGSKPG